MLVQTVLPGMGNTFLDRAFLLRVERFMTLARSGNVELTFNEAFRNSQYQANLHGNPGAITPAQAGSSLHEAGFAVDINYSSLRDTPGGLTGDQQRRIVREAAAAAGLRWGGDFSTPDRPHFYFDPGSNRQELVRQAQEQYRRLTGQR